MCSFFYASNEPKSVLARDLGDCRDNLRTPRIIFLIVTRVGLSWLYCIIVTIQLPLSREVFCHEYVKIPRHTSQNAITEGDFFCILAHNCEGTEQLQIIKEWTPKSKI